MATEYSITYTFTGQPNVSSKNYPMIVNKGKFVLSGDTDKHIGKITRIVYEHYHTSAGGEATWTTYGRLHFADGTFIESEEQKQAFNANVKKYTQTFPTLPTAEQFATWTQIETVQLGSSASKTLYWRAIEGNPITLTIYFESSPPVYYRTDNGWVEAEGFFAKAEDGSWVNVEGTTKIT